MMPKQVPGLGFAVPVETTLGYALTAGLQMKAESAGVPAPAPQPAPLPEDWAEQRGLLPVGPQGNITATRLPGGNCSLRVGNKPGVIIPLNSIAIPDTTRAVFIDQQCNVQPLVTIPVSNNPAAASTSVGTGSLQIPLPNNPNIQPASSAIALTAPETAAAVVNGVRFLGGVAALALSGPVGWSVLGGMAVITGAVAYEAWQTKQASGLSDAEIGVLATHGHGIGEQPMGQIQDRNQINASGNCTPDQHEALQNEVDRACKGQGTRSCSPQATPAPVAANNISKAMVCIAARQRINNICFMGGDDDHRAAIAQEHSLIANCVKAVNNAKPLNKP